MSLCLSGASAPEAAEAGLGHLNPAQSHPALGLPHEPAPGPDRESVNREGVPVEATDTREHVKQAASQVPPQNSRARIHIPQDPQVASAHVTVRSADGAQPTSAHTRSASITAMLTHRLLRASSQQVHTCVFAGGPPPGCSRPLCLQH